MTRIIRILPTLILFAGLVTVVAVGLAIVVTGILLYRYHKRSMEAGAVKRDITEALLEQDSLQNLTPTIRVPVWSGRPTITLAGSVGDPDLRRFACHIAAAEASRIWGAVRIEDRMGQPALAEHAA